jgi:serine protease 16
MFVLALLSVRMLLEFPKGVPTEAYQNKIDHFDPSSNKTFGQRFYTNLSFVTVDKFSYALIYIGGESALYSTSVTSGSHIKLAQGLGAAIFGIEHRFFGESQPFADGGASVNSLKYLSIEQTLADLAEFIDVIVLNHSRAGPNVRIGVIGGSYPGSLSSWFRLKYPHLAWASWASSAPVLVKNDFFEYDEYIADQAAQVSDTCLTNLQQVFQYFHNATATGDDAVLGAIRRDYNFSAEQDNISVLYVLVDILAGIVQYNSRYRMLTPLCGGLVGNLTADVATYHKWAMNWTKTRGETVQDIDLMMATEAGSSRSWSWMTCTEVGWFQTASGKLRSPFLNLTYFRNVCS